jgi:hypothetical protein
MASQFATGGRTTGPRVKARGLCFLGVWGPR